MARKVIGEMDESPDKLTVGAWLPGDWRRPITFDERRLVESSDVDLLLIPENHDKWANRGAWKEAADEMETAIYAGFEDGGWTLGLFYDPRDGTERVYTKHSTSERIALEREDWTPEEYLYTLAIDGVQVGTTICHDHYLSPFMRYERLNGADALLNLSASPVVRRKWGEVLQARAIENAAYVFCTMHGLETDGSEPGTNKGHVFAFDPFGDQLQLTELGTGRARSPFETESDRIYAADVDPALVREAVRTLDRQAERPSIERVRENEFSAPKPTDTTLDVRVTDARVELTYADDASEIPVGESEAFRLGDERFYLVSLEAEEGPRPELLYEPILDVPDVEDRRIIIHNHWNRLEETYLDCVVEPVLRARCVEWCSPALVTDEDRSRAYQLANKHKDTHRIPRDSDGRFNFEVKRAFGVSSALKPVEQKRESLQTVAAECAAREAPEREFK